MDGGYRAFEQILVALGLVEAGVSIIFMDSFVLVCAVVTFALIIPFDRAVKKREVQRKAAGENKP